jgi:transcriptional antiterminator NusG
VDTLFGKQKKYRHLLVLCTRIAQDGSRQPKHRFEAWEMLHQSVGVPSLVFSSSRLLIFSSRRNMRQKQRQGLACDFHRGESLTEGGEALAVTGARTDEHQPRTDGRQAWYAVWTQSHYENIVAGQLSAKGFSAFLPEMSVWSKRDGQMRVIRVPMFPGYLFVRDSMDKTSYIEILKSRGVVRILEDGWTRLTPVPDEEIEAIQQVVGADVPVFPHANLAQGARVTVTEGPLAGLEGIFIQGKATKGRLVINVELLGRSVAVEVDGSAVKACSSH